MAPKKGEAKVLPKKDATKVTKGGKVAKTEKKVGKPRNYDLGNGIYRFSKTRMFHKKAKYKFIGKKNPKVKKPRKPTTIEKPIGGDKNGGKRIVLVKKRRNNYPTAERINRHPSKKTFRQHTRYTRKSIVPGRICILLAGRHKGKRVVVLKVLSSGLLLVTGPFRINGCPLRRISQNYVIATKTKLNFTDVSVPEHIDDRYFRRIKPKRQKKEEGDIFATKKEGYTVSDKRKTDQKEVDKAVIKAIKKHPDSYIVVKYLAAMFGLKRTQYPHRLKF
ncbi:hypothetical protein RUM44_013260 [Polyplax serrata]|uniref:Large ribosomal subunit protein eL6 n=1 Tax=Polyplax serrata TaxID=468196 RepID=A0ABR1BDN0_POLSC